MHLTDELVTRYAAQITRYAARHTPSVHDAEDLAQDIVLALCTIDFPSRRIESMPAYIHGVCRYTLAQRLRRNAHRPVVIGGDELLEWVEADSTPEADFITAETHARLRREVMYLSRIRREAIIGAYYDGLDGDAVAAHLGVPPATVRWHLHRAKHTLKERMEMNESTIYRPRRLHVGHSGQVESPTFAALTRDLLMQNICRLCYDHPRTIEELAQILGVAAVYLEDKLDALCAMDYMQRSAKSRYTTNFVIHTAAYQLAEARYRLRETMPIARAYLGVIEAAMEEIVAVGCFGDVSAACLRWAMLYYFMTREIGAADDRMIAALDLAHGKPLRPDGTRHWVRGFVPQREVLEALHGDDCDEIAAFLADASGYYMQCSHLTPTGVNGWKLNLTMWGDIRPFGQREIMTLRRLRALTLAGEQPNEFDRLAIAELVEAGWVKRRPDGSFASRVPYFDAAQIARIDAILARHSADLDRGAIDAIFRQFAATMRPHIPATITENERSHHLTGYDPYNAIPYLLLREGLMPAPCEDEQGVICALIFEDAADKVNFSENL